MSFRQLASDYINNWWMPPLVALFALWLFAMAMLFDLVQWGCERLQITLLGFLGVSLLGIVVSAIWNFFRKQWKAAAIRLLIWLVVCVVSAVVIGAICFALHFVT